MKFETKRVGPAQAKILLSNNPSNRKPSKKRVEELANEMMAGRWMQNGDTIRIGKNKVLLDGQHRLMAIVESGVSLELAIAYDLDPNVFSTIDRGKKRSTADILHITGERNAAEVAATCRWILMYRFSDRARKWMNDKDASRISIDYYIDLMAKEGNDIHQSVETIKPFKPKIIAPSIAMSLHVLFRLACGPDAERSMRLSTEFWEMVLTGASLEDKSPELALRNRLVDNAISMKKFSHRTLFALCVDAWNLRVYNRAVSVLRARDTFLRICDRM